MDLASGAGPAVAGHVQRKQRDSACHRWPRTRAASDDTFAGTIAQLTWEGVAHVITVFGEGRGFRIVWLLEEMGIAYRLRPVDLLAGVRHNVSSIAGWDW